MTEQLAVAIGELAVTYLLHSTLLLVGAWVCLAIWRPRSPMATERTWKLAAIGALATVPSQWLVGWPRAEDRFSLATWTESAVRPDALSAASHSGMRVTSSLAAAPRVGRDGTGSASDPGTGSSASPSAPITRGVHGTPADSATPSDLAPAGIEPPGVVPPASSSTTAGPAHDGAQVARALESGRWPSGIVLVTYGLVGWTGGQVVLVLFQGLVLQSRVRRSIRPASFTTIRLLEELKSRAHVHRSVDLSTSELAGEPLACGLWRWRILIPAEVEKTLTAAELEALLAHELAHLSRGDVAWLWLGKFLCGCLAFQPLNFLARRRWQLAAEPLCDEWAVGVGVAPLDLARCLARIAEWRLGVEPEHRRLERLGLAASGSQVPIVERVERLLGEPRGDLWHRPAVRRSFAVAAIGVMLLTTWAGPRVVLGVSRNDVTRRAVDSGPHDAARFANSVAPSHGEVVSLPEAVDVPSPLQQPFSFDSSAKPWEPLDADLRLLEIELAEVCEWASNLPANARIAELVRQLQARRQAIAERRSRLATSPVGDPESVLNGD